MDVIRSSTKSNYSYHHFNYNKIIIMLTNKVILITGGSSGVGESCAEYFAKEGQYKKYIF